MAYAYYSLPNVPVAPQFTFAGTTPAVVESSYQATLSEEECLNGEIPKRCVRCGQMYTREQATNTACAVHTGLYIDNVQPVWSCCHKLKRDSPGCHPAPHHEDDQAKDQLLKFYYLTAQAESKRTVTPSMMPGTAEGPGYGKKKVVRADNMPKDGVIIHTLLPTDTLEGVSLKYDISKAEIIKANRGLSTANFPAYRKLVIPIGDAEVILTETLSPEEKQKMEQEKLRSRFSRQFKVTAEEAGAYLGSHDYDYDRAAQDYKDDMAFESDLTAKAKPTLIFSSKSTKFTPIPSSSPSSSLPFPSKPLHK